MVFGQVPGAISRSSKDPVFGQGMQGRRLCGGSLAGWWLGLWPHSLGIRQAQSLHQASASQPSPFTEPQPVIQPSPFTKPQPASPVPSPSLSQPAGQPSPFTEPQPAIQPSPFTKPQPNSQPSFFTGPQSAIQPCLFSKPQPASQASLKPREGFELNSPRQEQTATE